MTGHILSAGIDSTDSDAGYGKLFAGLARRRAWFAGVFCSVLSVAVVIAIMKPSTFQSSMQLLVESNYQQKQGDPNSKGQVDDNQFTDPTFEIDYATQLNLMRSSPLLQKAVDLLAPKYPNLTVAQLQNSKVLTLSQLQEGKVNTRIIQITYIDSDPQRTQDVLVALQKVYQEYNLQQQKLRLTKGLGFIDAQLPEAKTNLIQAEENLEKFRKRQNLTDPVEQSKAMATALNTVQQERRNVRAQYEEQQASYNNLQQQLGLSSTSALTASRLSQSSRYQTLLNDMQKTDSELAKQRLRYTESHPIVQDLLKQRQDQLTLLAQESGRLQGNDGSSVDADILTQGQLGTNDLNLTSQIAELEKSLSGLSARDVSLAQTEQQLRTDLNRFPALLAEYNRLLPEVQIKQDSLQQFLRAKQDLGMEIAKGGFNWEIAEPAQPGRKSGLSRVAIILLGAIIGAFLGVIAAFIREVGDDSVRTSDDLKKRSTLALLGIIPELPTGESNKFIFNLPFRRVQNHALASGISQTIYDIPFRECLDLTYKNIELFSSSSPLTSLVITSALAGEGKSTIALGLALSAARLHRRVLLIDADLRRPSLHKQLNLNNDQGLSTVLAGDTNIPARHTISRSGATIDVLTSGPIPTDPVNLLSSQRMGNLIAAFERTYDLVILDTPPILGLVDAIQAASFCSGVVLVGRIDQVTQTELSQAIAMLNRLNVVGVIANGANGPRSGYTAYAEKYVSATS